MRLVPFIAQDPPFRRQLLLIQRTRPGRGFQTLVRNRKKPELLRGLRYASNSHVYHNEPMAGELLASAYEAARHSKPDVRVAALLRIARVETALDRGQARRAFEQALDEVQRIPGRDGASFLEHARLLAAAIAPDLLPSIPVAYHRPRHLDADSLGRIMMEHGNLEAAMELAMRIDDASTFPFSLAGMLMDRVSEQERLALLRRAVEAWREAHGDAFFRLFQFVWLFQHRWKLLPEEEARDVLREIVRVTLSEPDKPTESTFDQEGTIKITSLHEQTLFQVLHILRHLDQPLLESLLSAHPQFAAAAQRFPYGMESIQQEADERRKSEGGKRTGFIMSGRPDDFPYFSALMRGSQDGDFEQAMEYAQQQYVSDSASEDQNLVPREFWPSTSRFRSILYKAGKLLGEDAARYLTRIDDPDLRLLAQIELAAALAGLPEFGGIQRTYRRPPTAAWRQMPRPAEGPPVLGPGGKTIRCPKCNWVPHHHHRWGCKCGHVWNTFETGGSCPACRYQWDVTVCLSCGGTSAHSDWYMRP
jgi:hypothetical protein